MYDAQWSSISFMFASQSDPSKNQLARPGSEPASESESWEKSSSSDGVGGVAASSMKDIVGTCPN